MWVRVWRCGMSNRESRARAGELSFVGSHTQKEHYIITDGAVAALVKNTENVRFAA